MQLLLLLLLKASQTSDKSAVQVENYAISLLLSFLLTSYLFYSPTNPFFLAFELEHYTAYARQRTHLLPPPRFLAHLLLPPRAHVGDTFRTLLLLHHSLAHHLPPPRSLANIFPPPSPFSHGPCTVVIVITSF